MTIKMHFIVKSRNYVVKSFMNLLICKSCYCNIETVHIHTSKYIRRICKYNTCCSLVLISQCYLRRKSRVCFVLPMYYFMPLITFSDLPVVDIQLMNGKKLSRYVCIKMDVNKHTYYNTTYHYHSHLAEPICY